MEDAEIFRLIPTEKYKKCRKRLDEYELKSSDDALTCLETNVYGASIRYLREPYKGKSVMRFANESYRLIIQVNWNTRKIISCHLASRSHVYHQHGR